MNCLDVRVAPGDRRRCGDHLRRQRVRQRRGLRRVAVLDSESDERRIAWRIGDDPVANSSGVMDKAVRRDDPSSSGVVVAMSAYVWESRWLASSWL